jgi:hypothetical protein
LPGHASSPGQSIIVDEVLTHALDYIEDMRLDAMVTEVAKEITHIL